MEKSRKKDMYFVIKAIGIFALLILGIWLEEAIPQTIPNRQGLPWRMEEGLANDCWGKIMQIKIDKKEDLEKKITSEVKFYALERKRLYFGADETDEVSLHPMELGLSARKLIDLLYDPRSSNYKKFRKHWRVIKKIASPE